MSHCLSILKSGLVSGLVAVAATGCLATSGDEGFVVLNDTAPPTSGGCTFTGDPTQAFTVAGTINALSTQGYLAFPLLQSRLQVMTPGEGSATGSNSDTLAKTIDIQGARVSLTLLDPVTMTGGVTMPATGSAIPAGLDQFTVEFSASLMPGATANVGFPLIPPDVLSGILPSGFDATDLSNEFSALVSAHVVVYGTLAGDEIDAAPWDFPVTVCTGQGCVFSSVGSCPATGTLPTPNPCNPYQDGQIACCENAANNTLVCPATTM